ncbi:PEP-CTERM sorting domain-containing protein [Duganella sp. PWIR1]
MKQLKVLLLAATAFASFSAGAANLITNGGFEDGSATGYASFTSDYTKAGNLYDPSIVTIGGNPNSFHSAWGSFGALEGSNMLIVNGGIVGTQNLVWSQTLNLAAGSYDFSAAAASTYGSNPSHVIAIATIGGTDYALGGVQLGSTVGQWDTFSGVLNVQSATSVQIKLLNLTTDYHGNDFAVDQISLTSAVPEPTTYAMLLAGLGMLGFVARRRRN